MNDFRNPAMKQLTDQQVRFAPPAKRREQALRAGRLLGEVDEGRSYPYQFVCYRVTDFRTDAYPDLLIGGADLKHDLWLMTQKLDRSCPAMPIEQVSEPLMTLEQAGKRFNVSTKTLRRWAAEFHLIGYRVLANGRRCLGYSEAQLEKFAENHAVRVARGSKFSHLSDEERNEMLTLARNYAREGHSLTEVSRMVAERLGRSAEAVRYTIRKFDQANPALAVFPNHSGPLDRFSKSVIFASFRRGIPMQTLVKRFQRTRPSVYRVISEVRAEQLAKQAVDYISNPGFDDPAMAEQILAPMPGLAEFEAQRSKMRVPKDVPAELAPLYEVPLLNKEQEQHLFRQMNYYKHLVKNIVAKFQRPDGTVDPSKVRTDELETIEEYQAKANAVKDLLISCNMRLVVSIAKRHSGQSDNFFELLSDGNISLMRAVEKFDYSRGNKFSTYASWAIMKNFARSIPDEIHRKERYVTGRDEVFDSTPDARSDEAEMLQSAEQAASRVNKLLEHLSPRDREIIRLRAGLDGSEPKTLEQIGQQLGITKERVRQLNVRIMKQLRDIAGVEPTEAS